MQKSMVIKKQPLNLDNINISKYFDLYTAMFMIIGFLLSRSMLIGNIAPLGIAFFLCISKIDKYKFPLFLSTLAGILLSLNETVYIAKYVICLFVFVAINKKLKEKENILITSIAGALVLFSISIGQAFLSKSYMYDILIAGMESAITLIAIYIFSFGVGLLTNSNNRISMRIEEAISLSLIITFSIMGVGGISLFGISLRVVLSTVLILVASIVGGATMGATSGVIVGVAFVINSVTTAIYMGAYSFAGLISGTFNKLNKYFCVLGYLISWFMIYVYTSGIDLDTMELSSILVASFIVILLPNKFFDKIGKIIKSNIASNDIVYDYIMRSKDITNNRLMNMYKTYGDLANTFDLVREKDKVIDQKDIAGVIDMIHNDECKNCSMRRRCWEVKFNHTYKLMCDILENLEENGHIGVNDISKDFKKECINPEGIVKASNYYYKIFALDYEWSVKFSENRKLIANQIRSISKSIEDLSKDLESNIELDIEKERNIADELERNNISVDRVNYISKGQDEFDIIIEKRTCNDMCMCKNSIIKILSEYLEEDLTAQKIGCNSLGQRCKITLNKAQRYSAVTEVATLSRDGYIYCGDNSTHMEIGDGKYMIAISDGMGKGKRAYEESSLTIDILEKMMDAKIDDEIVINTINNMLLLKSSDEMFSTLDLGIVDLKRGSLETVKMGACSTYIKREDEQIDLISSSSLPVGILSDVKLDRGSTKVNEGDYVIMVSDGIIDAGKNNNLGDNWLIYFLKKIESKNPKEIANLILDKALEIQGGEVEDDMTVLVTRMLSTICG